MTSHQLEIDYLIQELNPYTNQWETVLKEPLRASADHTLINLRHWSAEIGLSRQFRIVENESLTRGSSRHIC